MNKLMQYKGLLYRPDGKILQYPLIIIRGFPFSCTNCCNPGTSLEGKDPGRDIAADSNAAEAQLG